MIEANRLKEYGFVASLYFIVVGFLYLWGYWSSFDVNILEYINLTDIVKVTIIPILTSFGAFFIGLIASQVFGGSNPLPPGGGRDTPTGKFLIKYESVILGIYLLIVCLLFLFGPIRKWYSLPVLIAIPLAIALQRQAFLRDLFPSNSAHMFTMYILCILPFYAYGHGLMNADDLIQGRKYKYIELSNEKLRADLNAPASKQFKVIGFMNGYMFLTPSDGKTVIAARFESLEPISLKTFQK